MSFDGSAPEVLVSSKTKEEPELSKRYNQLMALDPPAKGDNRGWVNVSQGQVQQLFGKPDEVLNSSGRYSGGKADLVKFVKFKSGGYLFWVYKIRGGHLMTICFDSQKRVYPVFSGTPAGF